MSQDGLKYRFCPTEKSWVRTANDICPHCGTPTQLGRINREKPEQQPLDPRQAPNADPRVVRPVGNREVKKL